MNCYQIHSLLLEYSDGTLEIERQARVRAHLAGCEDCTRLAKEMAATRGLLSALAPQQTSAQFEVRLAERLALERQPVPQAAWWARLAAGIRVPSRALRPALAVCAAAAALIGIVFHPSSPPVSPPTMPPARESALVQQCVAQHQNDVAAQPLADPAAQNLAERLEGTTAGPPADAGLAEENL